MARGESGPAARCPCRDLRSGGRAPPHRAPRRRSLDWRSRSRRRAHRARTGRRRRRRAATSSGRASHRLRDSRLEARARDRSRRVLDDASSWVEVVRLGDAGEPVVLVSAVAAIAHRDVRRVELAREGERVRLQVLNVDAEEDDLAGEHWSVEYDQAWRDAYDRIARVMIMGADADSENPPYWHAEVISHERRSKDIAVFTCRPLQPLEYRAGQYVSMECKYQPRLWRVYSMANAPRKDGLMEFHIRALGAGWVSSALVWRLKPGDMIRLAAPMGSMVLDRHSTRDIVCVAGGTGLAPIKALVEELTQYNRTRWVHVFFGARDREDLYDLAALNRLAARYPWLTVIPACSADAGYSGERGMIADVVARYGPWGEHDFFVSGSPAMVKSTLRTLAELQVPAIRIKYDAFGDV